VQNDYYCREAASRSVRKRRTGDGWLLKLTKLIGDSWLELWRQRNAEVHGHDRRTQAEAERSEVSRQLEEIYRQLTAVRTSSAEVTAIPEVHEQSFTTDLG
jgi:hypothetical protein